MTDILEQAKDSLNSYEVATSHHIHPLYPVGLINRLVEEIETLRARPITSLFMMQSAQNIELVALKARLTKVQEIVNAPLG